MPVAVNILAPVALLAILLLGAIVIYNRLVRLRAFAREGLSGIDVQLRRRADLVPNLVRVVQAYAAHEREVLTQVTALRADAVNAAGVQATARADTALTEMLDRLMAVAESYPNLKADGNFRQLQEQLAEIEDQLQAARRYYNATVRDLNTRVQSFPDLLIARPMGFAEEPYYTDGDASIRTAPDVRIGGGR